jgi:hypothetical protein
MLQGFGLFILTLQTSPDPLETVVDPSACEEFPSINRGHIRVSLAKCFGNHPWLRSISCLQMTDTEVFFNWDPNDLLAVESMEYFHQLIEDGGEQMFPTSNAHFEQDSSSRGR